MNGWQYMASANATGVMHVSDMPSLAVDFFNHLNMLYGTITEFCTPDEVNDPASFNARLAEWHPLQCPVMCAGPRYAIRARIRRTFILKISV